MQISESRVGRAIRTKTWKYCVQAPGKSGIQCASSDMYVENFLYNLETDPYEFKNLVHGPALADVRKELAGILTRRMAEIGENIPEIRTLDHD